MSGKFSSKRDEVIYRLTLDGIARDEIGTVEDIGYHALILDLYGKDYILREDSQGFVTVRTFDTIGTNADGTTFRSAESGNAWLAIYDAWAAMFDYDDEEND